MTVEGGHYDGSRAPRPAYLLLEVVLALALLVLGLATIGAQIQQSWETAVDTHRMLRTMHLAESKMNELEAGLIMNIESAVENDLEEEFGRLFPSFGWRLRIEPTQTPELWMVRLQILYQERRDVEEEKFDFDEAKVLFTMRTLRATPARYNFCDMFPGLCEGEYSDTGGGTGGSKEPSEEAKTLNCVLDVLAERGIDPAEVDFREVAAWPIDELLGLFTDITACGVQMPGGMMPDEVTELLQGTGVEELGIDGLAEEAGGVE